MIKLRIIFFLLFAASNITYAQLSTQEIAILKTNMVKAVENPKLTDSLFTKLNKLANKTALITGYTGTLEALKAKHSWNPYNKIMKIWKSVLCGFR
jgi:hypothetical protein